MRFEFPPLLMHKRWQQFSWASWRVTRWTLTFRHDRPRTVLQHVTGLRLTNDIRELNDGTKENICTPLTTWTEKKGRRNNG
jgi:hypothetical protein